MSTRPARRSNQARTDATRSALIEAARRLFVDQGYAATGTPEVVAAAGVTRGALYHHFTDKADLLLAVAQAMAEEVAIAIASGSAGVATPAEVLERGAAAYFAAMAAGGRARLLLLDAPAVLAPEQLAQLSESAGAHELEEGLRAAGRVEVAAHAEEVAALLSAAFDRAALAVALGQPAERYEAAIRLLIDGAIDRAKPVKRSSRGRRRPSSPSPA